MRTYILALACLSLTAGCGVTAGERAWSNECPSGEVCSPNEARGLYFLGSPFSDDWLGLLTGIHDVAAGGTQTIQVLNADQHPLSYPFEAALQGGPFALAELAPPDVTLACSAEGSTWLRIIDRSNGFLLDKVEVSAQPVATAVAGPLPVEIPVEDTASWALLVGSAEVYVALHDGWDRRLSDESLVLAAVDDGVTAGAQVAWDAIALTRATAGTAQVAATAGDGRLRTIEVSFVEQVERVTAELGAGDPVAVGQSAFFCFAARSGDAQVHGAKWSFAVTGPLGSPEPFLTNCASVNGLATGPATLTATAGGQSTTLAIEVTLPPAPSSRLSFGRGAGLQPGLRALAARTPTDGR
jgi:hypothetical protein